jgi:hypothetical protein
MAPITTMMMEPKSMPADLIRYVGEQHNREQKAEKYGQTAHAGDGMVVHPAGFLGHVDGAHLLGKHLDHRGRQRK